MLERLLPLRHQAQSAPTSTSVLEAELGIDRQLRKSLVYGPQSLLRRV